jgi:hypothetical protein
MFDLEKKIADWRERMLAAGIKSPVSLEELESHLHDEIERQMKLGLSEQKSFFAAIEKIGDAELLNREFKKANSLINHNRVYSIVLVTTAFCAAMSSGVCWFLADLHTTEPLGRIPPWALPWVAALDVAYTIAIVITLFVRQCRPKSGRRFTRFLNWAILPAFPGGTIVGIYGLWVDRQQKRYV